MYGDKLLPLNIMSSYQCSCQHNDNGTTNHNDQDQRQHECEYQYIISCKQGEIDKAD